MSNNCTLTSNSLLKRQSTETETDFATKKAKLRESNLNDHSNDSNGDIQSEQLNGEYNEGRSSQTKHLVSFILRGQNRDVQIFPSQIVWCRVEKSAFWPAMVWPSKSGKITDDRKRKVLVSFFGGNSANIWMKLDNVFPFDGLESFERMKHSVNVQLLTRQMKKDYDFAFNVAMNEMWHRAVAEAVCCMRKDREERLSLFLTFSSSYKSQKIRKNTLHRRSIELNTSNRCLVKASRVNDEISRVESFINTISFSNAETPIDAGEIPYFEKMFLKFVTESSVSGRFTDGERCSICFTNQTTDHKLIKCGGTCDGYFHQKCVQKGAPQNLSHGDDAGGPNDFICENCTNESKMLCFICKASEDSSRSQMVNCKVSHCLRRYHTKCLQSWPQSNWTGSDENFTCPSHRCHQCVPDSNEITVHLTTCIKCPSAVHNDARCIHAGTVILSDTRHICIRHRKLRKNASNLDYCYICDMGYNLVRCRSCPHSYHEQCLSTASSSISTCSKCFIGQHPVYGDIVWAKLHTYSWWPAIIVPPHCIPENIRSDEHLPHDICVCFFGDHTFSFIDRQSIYAFEEDNFALFTENGSKFSDAILCARKWALQAKIIKRQQLQSSPSTSTSVEIFECPTPFQSIMKNVFVAPATRIIDSNNEASSCQCRAEDKENDDPCGVSSNCVNRASCTECNYLCPNAEKCKNKCVQQGKYPDVNLKYFGPKGFGLVATNWIPSGTMVQQYTGEVITTLEFEHRVQDNTRSNVYFMKYTKEHYIDGETKGSVARYINHSCSPNCEFRLWSVNGENVVVVIALKDIPKDTEITCKYDWSRQVPCLCNEENCSGIC